MRVLACAVAVLVIAGSAGCGVRGEGDDGLRVGLAYDIGGRGDKSFNDAAAAGMERVRAELRGAVSEVRELAAREDETEKDKYERLKLLCDAGFDVVIAVGYVYAGAHPDDGPVARAAKECPETRFAIVDDAGVPGPNVAGLVFAEEQGSFLVGVVAARRSRTGRVGFIGGCENSLIGKFAAGYQAGVRAAAPETVVDVKYLAGDESPCPGFTAREEARDLAGATYDAGADVVYHAAGASGIGVFEAARDRGAMAIGVDSDQYLTVGPDLRGVIITSMVKRVDTAVYGFVADVAQGRAPAGIRRYDLASGGVGYATSGGRIDDLVAELEAYRTKIIEGSVTVPTGN